MYSCFSFHVYYFFYTFQFTIAAVRHILIGCRLDYFQFYSKEIDVDTTDIILIKESWKTFRGVNPQLIGDIFYSKLFADNPSLRKMFPRQMNEQYQKLIDMLNTIVARLNSLHELADDIAAMARRHAEYGIKPAHYRLMGNALLWTLKQGLGRDWTPETEHAWTTCYNLLADTMMNAGVSAK
jgi:hemoglobin-like flavoprotein